MSAETKTLHRAAADFVSGTSSIARPSNLDAEVQQNLWLSKAEGGFSLDTLAIGAVLELETDNRLYTLEYAGNSQARICGHPRYCPDPVLIEVHGSSWAGAMLKLGFIGCGMHLEYRHPSFGMLRTSRIKSVRERDRSRQESPARVRRNNITK